MNFESYLLQLQIVLLSLGLINCIFSTKIELFKIFFKNLEFSEKLAWTKTTIIHRLIAGFSKILRILKAFDYSFKLL